MDNKQVTVTKDSNKVSLKGWISLLVFIFMFSGVFPMLAKITGIKWLGVFDFSVLMGKFGTDLVGKNALAARRGFMEAFVLFPTTMLALGIVEICQYHGALRAAGRLFQPLFRPLMGIPGICGLAFVAALNSSDVGSVMTRQLRENDLITERERTVFVAYQYAGSAPIANTLAAGGALLPISVVAPGVVIAVEIIAKIVGANLVRLYFQFIEKSSKEAA